MPEVDWTGFIVASIAVVLAPGPGSLFVARTAAAEGSRAGRTAMLGIMLGDTLLIILSLMGLSALFTAYPPLFHAVRFAGAGYLILVGVQSLLTKGGRKPAVPQRTVHPLYRALAITLLNPKAVFFFMTFFPVFIRSGEYGLVVPYAGMTVIFMGLSGAYLTVLSTISHRTGSAFRGNRLLQSVARKACGSLFIVFGMRVAATSR